MLLYTSRGLHVFQEHKRSETWQPRPYPGIELRGKTALILGVGGIGTQIAIRAWAFGLPFEQDQRPMFRVRDQLRLWPIWPGFVAATTPMFSR